MKLLSYPGDEVLRVRGDELWEFDRRLQDVGVGRVVVFGLKRRLSHQKLKAQHAHAPDVHLLVMGLPSHHLRRQVVQGAANRVSPATLFKLNYII
jgi:hypothetical protein